MLEIERHSSEPADGSAGTQGPGGPAEAPGTAVAANAQADSDSGGGGRGLLRRARRAVVRPAGAPAAGAPAAAPSAGEGTGQAEQRPEQPAPAAEPAGQGTSLADQGADAAPPRTGGGRGGSGRRRGSSGSQGTSSTAAAGPGQDAAGAGDDAAAASPRTVPPAAFQPPLVIFQPPDISAVRPPAAQRPERPDRSQAGPSRDEGEDAEDDEGRDDGAAGSASRRRRRGGRGRGKGAGNGAASGSADGTLAAEESASVEVAEEVHDQQDDSAAEGAGTAKRRRRRRRTSAGAEVDVRPLGPDDPPNTVVHVRAPREKTTDVADVKAIKGSTRLEAKRQRRREGRESGRRRPPIITESEFLARREAVERVMVVRQRGDRTQIAVLEDNVLVEHYVDKASHQSYVGNVYLGKVQNVLPSMEAAFVDIGKGRNAVLYAGEVNFDASGLEGESKRIESALKSGQSILVQVTKDPIGHKGARLTSQVSLPGRYLVYVPGANMTGISRKLPDTERSRLKQILKQVMPENAGVIVRTAAEGASEEELSRDVNRLAAQWEAIEKKSKIAAAPDLLYSEPDLTLRVVRDIFNEDFTSLVIASDSEWDLVDEYVRYVAPHLADRMKRWDEDRDVFAAYRIDEQLAKALERKVWLPSGGSLVIDHTEAMTVIDVNTGKFTGQGGNLEQTVTRNNLEAAEEIVRQLRLRDLGGIIVIDFIDMVLESNRELVLRRLLECLARDRTKHQVAEVTSLGLVQMTRKRVGSGLLEAFSVPCEHCNGRGVITSLEPVDHARGRDGGRGGSGSDSARDSGGRDSGARDSGGRDVRESSGDGRESAPAGSSGRSRRSRAARPAGPPAPRPPAPVTDAAAPVADAAAPVADAGPASPDGAAVDTSTGAAFTSAADAGPATAAPGSNGSGRSRSASSRRSRAAQSGDDRTPSGTEQAGEPAGS